MKHLHLILKKTLTKSSAVFIVRDEINGVDLGEWVLCTVGADEVCGCDMGAMRIETD